MTIPLDDKAFRYWNTRTNQWEREGGSYQIMVGASVSDIRLEGNLLVKGTTSINPYQKEILSSYFTGDVRNVPDREYETLLGRPIPDGKWGGKLEINDAICQMYYAKSRLARWVYRMLEKKKKKSEMSGKPDLNILFIYNMPFRGIAKMTNGAVSMEMVYGIVDVVNGCFFRGVSKIIGGYFRNRRWNREYEQKLCHEQKESD